MHVHHAGSMFETRKRWRVPYLIYLLAAIMLAEIAFNGELSAVTVTQRETESANLGPGCILSGLHDHKW